MPPAAPAVLHGRAATAGSKLAPAPPRGHAFDEARRGAEPCPASEEPAESTKEESFGFGGVPHRVPCRKPEKRPAALSVLTRPETHEASPESLFRREDEPGVGFSSTWPSLMLPDDTQQLHFRLSTEVALRLLRSRIVRSYRKGRAANTRRADSYFDTPRHALRKSEIQLKVSGTGSKRVQEVRAPAGESGFREWRIDLGSGDPKLGRLDSFPSEFSRRGWDAFSGGSFYYLIDRTTVRLGKGGAVIDLAIDVGYLRADRKSSSPVFEDICEAELTLVSGDPSQMLEVALELIESDDLTLSHQSLAVRGYALLKPWSRQRAQKGGKVSLNRDMTVGEAFLASAQASLHHLFVNEASTLDGHPEGIHQSRVAIRRQRAALRAFKRGLPYGGRKAFNYEFRWFQKKMGPARDWHVFLDETIPRMIKDGVQEGLVEKLRRIARDERRRTSRDAAGYLASRR